MSRITKIILFFVCIVVVIAIGYTIFLYKNYVTNTMMDFQDEVKRNVQVKKITPNEQWLDQLSKNQDYSYPATETSFSIDFLNPMSDNKQSHRFLIASLDPYIFFCLKEVLKKDKVEYATSKAGKGIDVVLYLSSEQKEHVLKMLDYYGISYKNN
ncbi:hypothetical protein LW135_04920 [Helicobacter sp. faydin-H20]|uniref:hypothetical protein n=1 Tax=Helicobacter anatolicus TaxID=2905874 RepID=UPI001E41BFCA|nr:hypothetical protein [Helicobacter anatolicus]MCE3037169.1 hypothetical protein [Helicobacter anatolicus]